MARVRCDDRLKILVEPLPAATENDNLITKNGSANIDSSIFGAGVKNPFAPAGLDIGGKAPEKIVLSIVSEVAAILSGFLRERRSDIYPIVAAAGGEAV